MFTYLNWICIDNFKYLGPVLTGTNCPIIHHSLLCPTIPVILQMNNIIVKLMLSLQNHKLTLIIN